MKDIRVAAVIFHSPANKPRHNFDRMIRWIREAKKRGADIVCFPELNITGYGVNREIRDTAETIPGKAARDLSCEAIVEKIVILAGLAEKDENGHLFASHLVARTDGNIGVYRKLHISPPERDLFTPGCHIPLFDTNGITFGVQLCYDAHFPEVSTHMSVHGAEMIFIPHASPKGTPDEKYASWMRHLPARAYDNSLFVVACNQTGDNGKGLYFPGVAVIIGPSGEVKKKELSDRETILFADLKKDEMDRIRNHRMRFFLPNRRTDLYPF